MYFLFTYSGAVKFKLIAAIDKAKTPLRVHGKVGCEHYIIPVVRRAFKILPRDNKLR